ncbi:MAG: RidA family protein [Desulfobacterales bacterium]|nr:RidA family protein [Deltaproteobacteria bacterium]NNK95652.1 RidA family protein [Desulfobacterales bacterium]
MTEKRQIIALPNNKDLPFSTVVGFDKLIFVSGLIGRNPETGKIASDIAEQTRQTLANLEAQLDIAGLSLENVLKATVFITDMGLVQEMNQAYRTFFLTGLPARSCVQVTALPDSEALVEIEVMAHR